jgi:CRISPR/Cas system endoribonuclease Cas6 (RAMP superfamily)
MRFSIIFSIDKPYLPLDYRSGFISLLKAAYEVANKGTYIQLYEANTIKPYTFSVYFGNKLKITNQIVYIINPAI